MYTYIYIYIIDNIYVFIIYIYMSSNMADGAASPVDEFSLPLRASELE
jgi:hypothetical protein